MFLRNNQYIMYAHELKIKIEYRWVVGYKCYN